MAFRSITDVAPAMGTSLMGVVHIFDIPQHTTALRSWLFAIMSAERRRNSVADRASQTLDGWILGNISDCRDGGLQSQAEQTSSGRLGHVACSIMAQHALNRQGAAHLLERIGSVDVVLDGGRPTKMDCRPAR